MSKFPSALAKVIAKRWSSLVAGEYITPPCPPPARLVELLNTCYLTSTSPEEGRFPQFNVVAAPLETVDTPMNSVVAWKFDSPRPFTFSELRRLAPATDVKKSAIFAVWDKKNWMIAGLVDFGTSWHRTRVGLHYKHQPPTSLLVQVDRPGRLRVYQGAFHVATLADGEVKASNGIEESTLVLHESANAGLKRMSPVIDVPAFEEPREFENFEFIALWNTYVAIANSISLGGHGGMLIILPGDTELSKNLVKLKYESRSSVLRDSFVAFINARHTIGDYVALREDGHDVPLDIYYRSELILDATHETLVEATRFVVRLAGCDGSIVLSDDLHLHGFGGEIKAEVKPNIEIAEVKNEFRRTYVKCDIEQFGMRHRSAIKLASQVERLRILTISQDGPISCIWRERDRVFVRKELSLVNMNYPWS